jgi:polar amino acid transport system substrate-binding protein
MRPVARKNHSTILNYSMESLPTYLRTIACVLIAALAVGGCKKAGHPDLIIGMELAYPPFEMTDQSGAPAGVSVELAHALGDYLHQPVRIENIPFDGLIPSLKTGKIDLIISSMTATPERAQSIAFSDPYLQTGLCLLVGAKSPIQSIADADQPGRTIVVKKGTTGQLYAAKNVKHAKVLVLDRENGCVIEIVEGKADAFIYDQMSTAENARHNPETTRAILQPFQQESWAIGLRQGDEALREKVNAFLKDFRANGGFDRLGDKYLQVQKTQFRQLGIPFFF